MAKTKIAFIMVGVSGAGKSTIKKKLIERLGEDGMDVRVFSLDDCRMSFMHASHAGQWWSDLDTDADLYRMAFDYANSNQKEFDAHVNDQWAKALSGDAVIVDNTNLTKKSRARWVSDSKAKGFTVWAIQVMCPLQTVIDRQKSRGDKAVPEQVVRDMYMRQQEVLVGSEADMLMVVDGTRENANMIGHFHLA